MTTVPASIRWGMDAINAFFSFLLLLGSVATIRIALFPERDRIVVRGMALFWGFNGAYQVDLAVSCTRRGVGDVGLRCGDGRLLRACALALARCAVRAAARKDTPLDPAWRRAIGGVECRTNSV